MLMGMGWRGEENRQAVAASLRQALRAEAVRWGTASPLPEDLPIGDGEWLAQCWPAGGGVRAIVDPTATERLAADDEIFTLVDLLADPSVGLGPVLFSGCVTDAPREVLPAPEIILEDGDRIRRPAGMAVVSRWPARIDSFVEKALILDPEAVGAALSGGIHLPFAAVLRARSANPRAIALAWVDQDARNAPDLAVWNLCRQEGLPPPVLVVGKDYLRAFPVRDVRPHWGAEQSFLADEVETEPVFRARTTDVEATIGDFQGLPPKPPKLPEAPKPGPRWLNAALRSVGRGSRPVAAFTENRPHFVEVSVGLTPPRGDRTQPTFPDHLLLGRMKGNRVRVIVTEPKHLPEPVVGWLTIPPVGEAPPVRLRLPRMQAGRFDGRVLICRGSRILQTARLKAAILPQGAELSAEDVCRLDIEAVIDPSLGDQRVDFDVAFLINDTHGEPQLTVINREAIDVKPLGDDHINFLHLFQARLDQLVEKKFRSLTTTPAELWYMLAHQGADLFANIVGRQLKGAADGQRFQIISAKPDGFLPLEYVYQFEPPEEGAGLCPQAQTALMGGCSDCNDQKREGNICPLGFWGATKIIERHVFNADHPDGPLDHYRVFSDENGERTAFGAIDASLLGASKVVEDLEAGRRALSKLKTSLAKMTPRAAETVSDWKAWTAAVAKSKPQILVLLSHTYIDEVAQKPGLEIGGNARQIKTRISKNLVGDGNVIVLLLGCSTMNTANRCHDFHLAFCDAGAAVVIGTLSKTLGIYAAEAAEEIVAQLTAPGRPSTIGDALKAVRRRLLANGRLIGLSIIAFGDADWKLGGTA
ncbi:MAG: hypothetical protein WCZ23_00340 [Rhodospirillaceae bacterium]